MRATALLPKPGQSLWPDNITGDPLDGGALKRDVAAPSPTGLTSDPTGFENAAENSADADADIRRKLMEGRSKEELFFDLAPDDLTGVTGLLRPIYDQSRPSTSSSRLGSPGVEFPATFRKRVDALRLGRQPKRRILWFRFDLSSAT